MYTPKKQAAKSAPKTASKKMEAPSFSVDKNMSTSVRGIENGFIVSQSGYIGKGKNQQYVNKDFFSPTDPLKSITKPKFGKK